MSASETGLSSALKDLDVQSGSAFNTPASGTPIPAHTLSSETVNLLDEVASRLNKERMTASRSAKRKRTSSPSTDRESSSRDRYPPAAKSHYFKAKNMYRKKLGVATSLHHVKNQLKEGNFTSICNFRCSPPQSENQDFKTKWTKIVRSCKRELTLLWVEQLNHKYSVVKTSLQAELAELQKILSTEQFSEIKNSLDSKYKDAAKTKVTKKLLSKENNPPQNKRRRAQPRRKQQRSGPNRRLTEYNELLTGLAKLIKSK